MNVSYHFSFRAIQFQIPNLGFFCKQSLGLSDFLPTRHLLESFGYLDSLMCSKINQVWLSMYDAEECVYINIDIDVGIDTDRVCCSGKSGWE